MTKRKASAWKSTGSTASIKAITTGDTALTSTVSTALTKTIMTGAIVSMSTISTALTKTIVTGTITSMSTVSAALIKTKTPAGADPAAVTMTRAKENRPLCSRKMPDSDEAMIHWHRLIA